MSNYVMSKITKYWQISNTIQIIFIKATANKFRTSNIEEISIKSDAKKMIIKYQKLLLLFIFLSFRPILWPWSHNIYKQVSAKFRCYYFEIC